jgi:hypothetical protein
MPTPTKTALVHGRRGRGERAASALLEGFEVDVTAVFDAAKRRR